MTVDSTAKPLQHRRERRQAQGLGRRGGSLREYLAEARGARVIELVAPLRAPQQIALQVLDFDRTRRIVHELPERGAAQDDGASFELGGTDGKPDRIALIRADAHEAVG